MVFVRFAPVSFAPICFACARNSGNLLTCELVKPCLDADHLLGSRNCGAKVNPSEPQTLHEEDEQQRSSEELGLTEPFAIKKTCHRTESSVLSCSAPEERMP